MPGVIIMSDWARSRMDSATAEDVMAAIDATPQVTRARESGANRTRTTWATIAYVVRYKSPVSGDDRWAVVYKDSAGIEYLDYPPDERAAAVADYTALVERLARQRRGDREWWDFSDVAGVPVNGF